MDGSDLRLYPLFDTATGDMLIRPFYPNTPTPHYISLDQVAAFVGAGSPGPPGPEGPAGPPGPGGGSGGAITLTGDVTGSGTGSVATNIAANAVGTAEIANSAVTYAKIQGVAANRLLGNPTGTSAVPSEISLGTNLSFVGNVLNATGGGGGLSGMTVGQIPIAASATAVASSANLSGDVSSNAALVTTLASVNGDVGTWQGLTVDAKGRVTAATNQGYLTTVNAASTYAPIASPALTGTPTAPTAGAGTNSTQIATTAFVAASFAPIGSPTFTGDPKAPTPATGDNDTSIATTAFVKAQGYQSGNSTITLSGDVGGSGTSAITVTIAASAVTYAKVQNVTAARLLGNPTGSSAAPSEITLGTNLSFSGTTLNATGGGTTPTVTTKTTNYTVQASDLGNTLVLAGATLVLTLPAGIFTPGKFLQVSVTASISWSVTNSTGLALVGLNSTTLQTGTSGTFIANADGTTLNFIPGMQTPTTASLGGVNSLAATTNNFLTGLSAGGTFSRVQPSFANLSGTATVAQGGTGATSFPVGVNAGTAYAMGRNLLTGATTGAVAADPVWGTYSPADGGLAGASVHATQNAYIEFSRGLGTPASPAAVTAATSLGAIQWDGYAGAGAWQYGKAQIACLATETWSGSATGAQLQLMTTNTGTTALKTEVTILNGIMVGNPTGGLKGNGTINAVSVSANNTVLTSDARLKRDIEELPPCLALVEAIAPKSYRWKPLADPQGGPEDFPDRVRWGFVAQEVETAANKTHTPFAGIEGDKELGLDVGALIAVLWQSVRELSDKVEALEDMATDVSETLRGAGDDRVP